MQSAGDNPGKAILPRLLFLVGAAWLVFYAALLVLQSGALVSGSSLSQAGTFLAAGLALGYFWLVGWRLDRLPATDLAAGVAALVAATLLCGWVAACFFDLSWDGRDYHQKAVRQLAGGWNPVYVEMQPRDAYDNAWLNHYPKGAWVASASALMLTGDIESGKLFNLLLLAAVLLVALSAFMSHTRLRGWQALLLALFLAANPVSLYQSLSYYVDGQVSSVLILLGLCMLLCLRSADLGHLVALGAVIVVGLNIKFTGTAYTLLLVAVFSIASLFAGQFGKRNRSEPAILAAVTGGLLLGMLLVGFQPYATNWLRYGHPFYPIYGSPIYSSSTFNKEFVLRGQVPPDFETMGWLEKLTRSIFSPSDNQVGVESGPLKFPLSVSRPEVMAFARPDVRVSGWGPLYGALLLTSLVALVSLAFVAPRLALVAAGGIALLLGSALLNSEAWWARYTPQLWLVPVIALGALWLADARRATGRRLRLLGYLFAALMVANIVLVAGAYFGWNARSTRQLRATLAELRQQGEEVMLYYGPLEAAGIRLQEYGIPYRWVERRQDLPCPVELELRVFYSPLDCSPAPP